MDAYEDAEPSEIARRLLSGERLRLIDVRERDEWDLCRIEGAELMPLSRLQEWQDRLGAGDGRCVVYCHVGIRSRWVCAYLAARGVEGLVNLSGGIDRWSRTVDPGLPLY